MNNEIKPDHELGVALVKLSSDFTDRLGFEGIDLLMTTVRGFAFGMATFICGRLKVPVSVAFWTGAEIMKSMAEQIEKIENEEIVH